MAPPLWLAVAALLRGGAGLRLATHDRPRFTDDTTTVCTPKHRDNPPSCKMGADSSCPLAAMEQGKSHLVWTGGQTRCLDPRAGEYAFQVMPGSREKLLLIFEGGGACWNKLTWQVYACSKRSIEAWDDEGVLSRDPMNPYSDHTVVLVQYCSGDLHSGNVTNSWKNLMHEHVQQFGYHNTRATVEWTKANMADELESLVISGSSAGAIAAQVWASALLREFRYARASVIADSYAAVFPDGFQGIVFNNLAVCDLDIIRPELKDSCRRGDITIADVFEFAMQEFPSVPFANIQNKFDGVQLSFFNEAALTMGMLPNANVATFYPKVYSTMARHNKHPNYVSCVLPLHHHIFQLCDDFYTLPVGEGFSSIADWERQFVASSPSESLQSVCVDGPNETAVTQCDPALNGKQFARPS